MGSGDSLSWTHAGMKLQPQTTLWVQPLRPRACGLEILKNYGDTLNGKKKERLELCPSDSKFKDLFVLSLFWSLEHLGCAWPQCQGKGQTEWHVNVSVDVSCLYFWFNKNLTYTSALPLIHTKSLFPIQSNGSNKHQRSCSCEETESDWTVSTQEILPSWPPAWLTLIHLENCRDTAVHLI